MNRTFYAAKPADYFGRRLSNLILTAGRHADLDKLTDEGVTYRGLKVSDTGVSSDPQEDEPTPEDRAKAAEHYVIAEAEVLAQHAGETLLRLYLAHEFAPGKAPPSPWLEISRERSPQAFKDKVRARFGPEVEPSDPDRLKAIARVFHLVDDPTTLKGDRRVPQDPWDRSLTNIEGYLRGYAEQFLKRAPLYNAAKHGLALRPDEASMRMDDGSVIRAEGPMIQVLELQDRDGRPRWSLAHHWVKPDRQMALTYRAIQLIETLWQVARIRYVPEQRSEQFRLRLFHGASWHDIMLSDAEATGGVVVETMAIDLIYYRSTDEISEKPVDDEMSGDERSDRHGSADKDEEADED